MQVCEATWTVAVQPDNTCQWRPLRDSLRSSDGLLDPRVNSDLLEAWSIYNFQPNEDTTASDHFFASFNKFGGAVVRQQGLGLV